MLYEKKQKMIKIKKAYTLIELIVVIAIIAILAAIITPIAFKAIEKAKISATLALINTLKKACNLYYLDTGEYATETATSPPDDSINHRLALYPAVNPPLTEWDGPYIPKPLVRADNPIYPDRPVTVLPYNNHVYTERGGLGYDFDGDTNIDADGPGNTLIVYAPIDNSEGEKLNDIIDGEEGADWQETGRLEVHWPQDYIVVYLMGE